MPISCITTRGLSHDCPLILYVDLHTPSHFDDQIGNPHQRPINLNNDDDKMGSSASALQDDGSAAEEDDAGDAEAQ